MALIGPIFPEGITGRERKTLTKTYAQPTLDHIVATSWSSSKPAAIPNAHEILEKHSSSSETVALYRQARIRVPFSSGLFKMRIDAAMYPRGTWVAGDPSEGISNRYRDEIAVAFEEVPFLDFAMRNMLFAIADGISFAEVIWRTFPIRLEGRDVLALLPCLIDRYPEKFYFATDGNIWWRGNARNPARAVSPLQVIVGRYGSAGLYGLGDTRDIYNDLWKWDKIDTWGLEALEKQGWPLVEIILPAHLDDKYTTRYVGWARKTYKNFIVLKWGDQFKIQHPQQSVMVTYLGRDQIDRLRELKDSISIGILSVAFSNGAEGSFARDKARSEIRYEKTPTDVLVRRNIAHAWRDRYAWANFGDNIPKGLLPRFKIDVEPNEDLTTWTTNMTQWVDRGYRLPFDQITERFGARLAEDGEEFLSAPTAAAPQTPAIPGLANLLGAEGEDVIAFADNDGAVHRISRTHLRTLLGQDDDES